MSNIQAVQRSALADNNQSKAAPFPTKFRVRHARTKTGCLGCRARKKKCDEARPCCGPCQLRNARCCWPGGEDDAKPSGTDTSRELQQSPARQANSVSLLRTTSDTAPDHAVYLTPESHILLRYQVTAGFTLLSDLTAGSNKHMFESILMPSAQKDETLMHAVLAVGAIAVAHKAGGLANVETAKQKHYQLALQRVRRELQIETLDDPGSVERLLLILSVLTQYEIMNCSGFQNLAFHLLAFRQLLYRLRARHRGRPYKSHPQVTVARAMHLHIVLLHTNSLPALPDDLETKKRNQTSTRLRPLQFKETPFFTSHQQLFALVLKAETLYHERIASEALHPALAAKYKDVEEQLEKFGASQQQYVNSAANKASIEFVAQQSVIDCMRHALHIHIAASRSGKGRPPEDALQKIERHIQGFFQSAKSVPGGPLSSGMMWAPIVVGSSLRRCHAAYRAALVSMISPTTKGFAKKQELTCYTLDIIWNAPDDSLYGPHGLHVVAARENKYTLMFWSTNPEF